MDRLKLLVPLIGIALLDQSCAVLFSGSSQQVTFQTERKAMVKMNMREIGETNEPIRIRKGDFSKLYTIELEGCETKHVELPIHENGFVYLDAFLCGLSLGTFLLATGVGLLYWGGVEHDTTDRCRIKLRGLISSMSEQVGDSLCEASVHFFLKKLESEDCSIGIW